MKGVSVNVFGNDFQKLDMMILEAEFSQRPVCDRINLVVDGYVFKYGLVFEFGHFYYMPVV